MRKKSQSTLSESASSVLHGRYVAYNLSSLLQQPSYILKEFLDSNAMALGLYGATLASDTYGVLRLKLMSYLVAVIQDLCAVENVDSMLSHSDIYYIAHVGGVLVSSQRRFSSDIFIIFDLVDVGSQLAGLFDSKMSVLISPPPRTEIVLR